MFAKEQERLKLIAKRDPAQMFVRLISREMKIYKFIGNLKSRVAKKRIILKRSVDRESKDPYLTIQSSEQFEIEELAISMKGDLKFAKVKLTERKLLIDTVKDFLEGKNSRCAHGYFVLAEECLIVKESAASNRALHSLYFAGMKDIGVEPKHLAFYFVDDEFNVRRSLEMFGSLRAKMLQLCRIGRRR